MNVPHVIASPVVGGARTAARARSVTVSVARGKEAGALQRGHLRESASNLWLSFTAAVADARLPTPDFPPPLSGSPCAVRRSAYWLAPREWAGF